LAKQKVSLDGQTVLKELVLVHEDLQHASVDHRLHLGHSSFERREELDQLHVGSKLSDVAPQDLIQ
jgi:hypothetical protein